MRMLRIIASMDPAGGGPCQGIRNSAPELTAHGITTEVVALDSPDSTYLGKDPFPIHAIGKGSGPWCHQARFIPWLAAHLGDYDAVVIHGLWLYHGYATARAIRILRKKAKKTPSLFVMPHGMLDPYFQKAGTRKLKAIRNLIYWKLIERHIIRQAGALLFTCEQELLLARTTFNSYHPQAELNVGYGIASPPPSTPGSTDAFLEICPSLGGRNFLLFLSRIHEKKGVDLLIRAYAEIFRLHPGTRLPALVIAGPLDSPYADSMKQLATDLLPPESVLFPGMLTGDSKWGAFHLCETFILPSHQENFGIAVAEALACAKPVLISNQINIHREIEAANAGIIANDDLAGTIDLLERWLALDEPARRLMAANAADTYASHFAIRPAAEKFAAAIRAHTRAAS